MFPSPGFILELSHLFVEYEVTVFQKVLFCFKLLYNTHDSKVECNASVICVR